MNFEYEGPRGHEEKGFGMDLRAVENFAGRRCEQEALLQCFCSQPDGQHGLGRMLRSQRSFPAANSWLPGFLLKMIGVV